MAHSYIRIGRGNQPVWHNILGELHEFGSNLIQDLTFVGNAFG